MNDEDPVEAIQQAVEWVAPVWVAVGDGAGEVDWPWLAARLMAEKESAGEARAAGRRVGTG